MEQIDKKLYSLTFTYYSKICYRELINAMNHSNNHNVPGAYIYKQIGPGDILMKIECDKNGYGLYYVINKKVFCYVSAQDIEEVW